MIENQKKRQIFNNKRQKSTEIESENKRRGKKVNNVLRERFPMINDRKAEIESENERRGKKINNDLRKRGKKKCNKQKKCERDKRNND